MNMIRVAMVQACTEVHDRHKNLDKALRYMERAKVQEAHIVCFPETYPGPWTPPIDYDPLPTLCRGARENDIHVIAGLTEPVLDRDDWYHVLADSRGYIYLTNKNQGLRILKYTEDR